MWKSGRYLGGIPMKKLLIAGIALALATPAAAQLTPYEDYSVSDSVSVVATVKVKENMIEDYLEGIRNTWAASNEVAKELGHIASYGVYVSDLPNGGDFNVLLVTRFANTADFGPSKARYDAFMQAWGNANEDESRKVSTTVYPNIRTIVGEYMMREVTFMPKK